MIDKINGNDVYGYADQKKRKNPAVKAYENTPGQKDAAGRNVAQKKNTGGMHAKEKDSQGVILDLSNQSGSKKAKAAEAGDGFLSGSLPQVLHKLFAPVIRWLKNFWESDTSGQAAGRMDLSPEQIDLSSEQINLSPEQINLSSEQMHAAENMDRAQGQAAESTGQEQPAESTGQEPAAESIVHGSSAESIGQAAGSESYTQAGAMAAGISGGGTEAASDLNSNLMQQGIGAASSKQLSETDKTIAELLSGTDQAVSGMTAYEILESSQMEDDAEGLPPLEDIDDLPKYGAISDEAVKSGSLEQIEQLLTRNGARQLAHNSDLLTYYDRWGRIIELDETQRHRVLFGDKNVMKL